LIRLIFSVEEFNYELFGVSRRGRPRKRWLQNVKDDLRRMSLVNGKRKDKNKMPASRGYSPG
jgi:hypothetical protein